MQEQQENLDFFSSGTFLDLSVVVIIVADVLPPEIRATA